MIYTHISEISFGCGKLKKLTRITRKKPAKNPQKNAKHPQIVSKTRKSKKDVFWNYRDVLCNIRNGFNHAKKKQAQCFEMFSVSSCLQPATELVFFNHQVINVNCWLDFMWMCWGRGSLGNE